MFSTVFWLFSTSQTAFCTAATGALRSDTKRVWVTLSSCVTFSSTISFMGPAHFAASRRMLTTL